MERNRGLTTVGVDVIEGCGEEEPDGVLTLASPTVTATPNPAQDQVRLAGWTEGTVTVVFRNALGQTLMTRQGIAPGELLTLRSARRDDAQRSQATDGQPSVASCVEPWLRKAYPTLAGRKPERGATSRRLEAACVLIASTI